MNTGGMQSNVIPMLFDNTHSTDIWWYIVI